MLGGACSHPSSDLGPPPTVFSPIGSVAGQIPSVAPPSATSGVTDSTAPPTQSLASTVDVGSATATVTGGVNSNLSLTTLAPPRAWALPPSTISLNWVDQSGQSVWLSGQSFTSRVPTSGSEILSISVLGADGTLQRFRSAAGECSITISTALADRMDGIFDCQNLRSTDGTITISAQGAFTAAR